MKKSVPDGLQKLKQSAIVSTAAFILAYGGVTGGILLISSQPVLAVSSQAVEQTYTNQESINLTWLPNEAASSYQVKYWHNTSHERVRLLSHETVTSTIETSDNNYLLQLNKGEGTYYWQVTAIDETGNALGWSETMSVTYDVTSPTLIVTSPKSNLEIVGSSVTVTGSVTDLNFDYYNYRLETSTGALVFASGNLTNPVLDGVLAYIETAALPAGPYQVIIKAIDKAGNTVGATEDLMASFEIVRKGGNDKPANEAVSGDTPNNAQPEATVTVSLASSSNPKPPTITSTSINTALAQPQVLGQTSEEIKAAATKLAAKPINSPGKQALSVANVNNQANSLPVLWFVVLAAAITALYPLSKRSRQN